LQLWKSPATRSNMCPNRFWHFAGLFFVSLALGCGLWPPGAAAQQSYPDRLIKIIHPYGAGGPTDLVTRAVAEKMSVSLKQPIVVENRQGASGNIGTEMIARAAPDGYTLGVVLGTTLTANPSLHNKLPFDPDRDFRMISIVATSGNMLVVHPSIPVNSVKEFVAFARAAASRREPVNYASGGIGTPGHLVMENFRVHTGFDAVHVPYRGNAPMVVDLVAGHVKIGFVTSAGMMDHVRAGRLKGLGVSHSSRAPLAPDVPTIAESGYADFKVENIAVMLAPAGIPEPIAALLEREVQAALKHPEIIERLRAMDTIPAGIVGPEVQARLKADRSAWAKVVAAANMRLD
jgi:tripartite-type tricarboxylate transporter receptor subunit TctC